MGEERPKTATSEWQRGEGVYRKGKMGGEGGPEGGHRGQMREVYNTVCTYIYMIQHVYVYVYVHV